MSTDPVVLTGYITLRDYCPSQPLVSVLMPSYNQGQWVFDALESVWNQTYRNIQVIMINDGSTDDTSQKVRRFRREVTDRFIYIEQQNEGVVKTMNRALDYVHGEYVTILASDDMLCPDKVSVQVDLLESLPHVDSVFCPQYEINEKGEIIGTRGFLKEYFVGLIGSGRNDPAKLPTKWDVAELVLGAVAHPFAPQSALARARVFQELKGFDERTELDDVDFNLRAAVHGFVPRFHPAVLHKVRIHDSTYSRRPWWLYNETMAALGKFYSQPGIPLRLLKYRRYLRALHVGILASNLRYAGRWGEAIVQYAKLSALYPEWFVAIIVRHVGRRVRQWNRGHIVAR